jgi:hypothetical protein
MGLSDCVWKERTPVPQPEEGFRQLSINGACRCIYGNGLPLPLFRREYIYMYMTYVGPVEPYDVIHFCRRFELLLFT